MAFLLRVGTIVLVSTTAWGQSAGFTVRLEVPVASVEVSVTDADGQPVDGLEARDFELFEDGVSQPIRYFGPASLPYHVRLLLDTSASTDDQRPLMREIITEFVGSLRSHDRVSIAAFGERTETLVDWDETRGQALDAIAAWSDETPRSGTTEFYQALETALDDGFADIDERRALVVVTDGRDASLYRELQQGGRLLLSDNDRAFGRLYETAAESGVAVYFIATNTTRNLDAASPGNEYRSLARLYPGSPLPDQYLEQVELRMEAIAHATGGEVLFPTDAHQVAPLLGRIAHQLGQAYSLGWAPATPEPRNTGTIEVRVANRDYRVRQSRTGY